MRQLEQRKLRSEPLIRWGLTIKFLALFFLGIALALGFSVLVSYSQVTVPDTRQNFLFELINPMYLNLTMAGTLGGLLYSMLIDRTLEFPSWSENDRGLKPAFLGDIFVGIAGSFIAYIALPAALKAPTANGSLDEASITIFVTGLIGGYGGKYVLDAALKRLVKRIDEAELVREKLTRVRAAEDLQDLVHRQLDGGLGAEELSCLQSKLQAATLSSEIKQRIFKTVRDARRLGSRVKSYEIQVRRAIPILEALVQSEHDNDRYHAQLACAYRDTAPPNLDTAIYHFDLAIELREVPAANNWRYEMDRVVALIHKAPQAEKVTDTQLRDKIFSDLQTIERNHGIARVFFEFDEKIVQPIKTWLHDNHGWLQKQPESKAFFNLPERSPAGALPKTQQFTTPITNGLRQEPESAMLPEPTLARPVSDTTARSLWETTVAIKPNRWDVALSECPTSGASSATAQQDRLPVHGTSASEKMAQADWSKLEPYAGRFYEAAVKYDIPPALIAAICSRESRGGSALAADGTGDRGNAFGFMQIDRRYHTQVSVGGDPGSQAHIDRGTQICADYRDRVRHEHPNWTDEYLLKGAVVAYNAGVRNVQTIDGMDRGTTGNDYGSDVIARAQYYAKMLKSLAECKAEKAPGSAAAENLSGEMLTPPMSQIHKITALRDTVLKKQPLQAAQLPEGQILTVAAGQSYDVVAYQAETSGHYLVRLADGEGEWYIYDSEIDGHWDTTWEGEERETSEPTPPAQVVGEVKNGPGSINWQDDNQYISSYFTVGEVTLRDPRRRPQPMSQEEKHILALAQELDRIRTDWGSAIQVTSWYRPPAVNRTVGGVSNSQHIGGRAVDIRPVQGNVHQFQSWLDNDWHGALGYGAKRGFVHLDIRNGKGWKSGGPKGVRWNY